MSRYSLDTQFIAQTRKQAELAAILERAATLMRLAPDSKRYDLHVDAIEPESLWITEEWDSAPTMARRSPGRTYGRWWRRRSR